MIRTIRYYHTVKTLKELIAKNGLSLEGIRRGIQRYSEITSKTPLNATTWESASPAAGRVR